MQRIYWISVSSLIAAGLSAALAGPVLADIYKYVDEQGHVYLTDRPNHNKYKLLVKTWKGWVESNSRIDYANLERNRQRYTPLIQTAAKHYRLPDALLHAVIRVESAYDPAAVSRAGAVGLMQLMPGTAQRYGVINRRDPAANVTGGTRYLRDLLAMFNNDLVLALAAYNAGEEAVVESGYKIPPYYETRRYVQKVLEHYRANRQRQG
jgi:soluble lytic murein transglycosylase-like protein